MKINIKNTFLKTIVVCITLCYVMGPAQIQVRSILHTISHNLMAPSYVLQHNTTAYEYIEKNTNNEEMVSNISGHRHQVLEILNMIFEAKSNGNDDHSNELPVKNSKIDKHLVLQYKIPKHIDIKNAFSAVWQEEQNLLDGYLKKLYHPPKIVNIG